MRRSFLLAIMVLGAVILTGSMAARAQQDPYEPATTTDAEVSTDTQSGEATATATATAQTNEDMDMVNDQDRNHDGVVDDRDEAFVDRDNDGVADMPRTASPLPLIALIGVLLVGTSLCLRMTSRFANGAADVPKH